MLIEHAARIETMLGQPPLYRARCELPSCFWSSQATEDYEEAAFWLQFHTFLVDDSPGDRFEVPIEEIVKTTPFSPHAMTRMAADPPPYWEELFTGRDEDAGLLIVRHQQAEEILRPLLTHVDLALADPDRVEQVMRELSKADPLDLNKYGVPGDEYLHEARSCVALYSMNELTPTTLWAVLAAAGGGEPWFGRRGAGCWEYLSALLTEVCDHT